MRLLGFFLSWREVLLGVTSDGDTSFLSRFDFAALPRVVPNYGCGLEVVTRFVAALDDAVCFGVIDEEILILTDEPFALGVIFDDVCLEVNCSALVG